jgi:ABC-2 type transport system permease protein
VGSVLRLRGEETAGRTEVLLATALLVTAGVTAALVALAPRLSALAWVVLTWAVLVGLFGALLGLPEWMQQLSPFGWTPAVPAEPFDVVPVGGLTLATAALATLTLAAFRRRDVPA